MVNKYKSDGKNGWYCPSNKMIIGDRARIEVWPGIYSTILQMENNYYLHLCIRHKVIHSSDVDEEIAKVGNKIEEDLPFFVVLTYSHEMHLVEGIEYTLSPESTFEKNVKGGGKQNISYMDYYKDRYGITIKNSRQPLLVVNQVKMQLKTSESVTRELEK